MLYANNTRSKFDDDFQDVTFMFDPFVAERVRFVDTEKQKEIDKIIKKIEDDEKFIIDTFKAKTIEDETFFITLAKDETPHYENGLPDKVIGLSCSRKDAYRVFHYYITQQSRNMRKNGNRDDFHQVGLYDAKTGEKIGQET